MTIFLSNSIVGLTDIAQLNPEFGASVYFKGINLLINISCFKYNTGFKGGAIYITSTSLDIEQSVSIFESYFKGNRGDVGGVINFSIYLQRINSTITSSIFHSNSGKSTFLAN